MARATISKIGMAKIRATTAMCMSTVRFTASKTGFVPADCLANSLDCEAGHAK